MDTFLNHQLLQVILAIATVLGGISAVVHLFFNKKTKLNKENMVKKNHSTDKHLHLELDNPTVRDVNTGTIESFNDNLLINGERLDFVNISSFRVGHTYKKKEYGNIFIHILINGVFRGINEIIKEASEGLKDGINYLFENKKEIIYIILAFILFFGIYELAKYLSIDKIEEIVTFVIYACIIVIVSSYSIYVFYISFIMIILIAISVHDYYFDKDYKVQFIEITTNNKIVYQIWIDHQINYNHFVQVFDSLKNTIFNKGSKRIIVHLPNGHHPEIIEKS